MKIHVVQEGQTINDIAKLYEVSPERVTLENEIKDPNNLVTGQTIVITFPEQTYIVKEGDTLLSISESFDISLMQLIRNNPYLSNREYIYPGETLTISYGNKIRKIITNGYVSDFIDDTVLRKTLPYLTFLSVFGYRIIKGGKLTEINDTRLIQTAKEYGVAPLLIISTLTTYGQENVEAAYNVLNNEDIMDTLIDNIVTVVKNKGYYGVNLTYTQLNSYTLSSYEILSSKMYQRLSSEGYFMMYAIRPNPIFGAERIEFERIDYTNIAQSVDEVIVLNYVWGITYGPPAPIASNSKLNEYLDYIIPQIPAEKLVVGLPLLAYDWELPYSIGLSQARSLSIDNALDLAKINDSPIQFDEVSQTPYFTYNASKTGITREHVVWFVDARSMDGLLNTVTDKGLAGTGIWNINIYIPQLWLVTNTQYEIITIPGISNQ